MYSDNVVARRTLQENVELIEELNAQCTELKDVPNHSMQFPSFHF